MPMLGILGSLNAFGFMGNSALKSPFYLWVLDGTTFYLLNESASLVASGNTSSCTSYYNESFGVGPTGNLVGACDEGYFYSISPTGSVLVSDAEPISALLYSQSGFCDIYGNIYIYIGGSGYLNKYNSLGSQQWELTGVSTYASVYSCLLVSSLGSIYLGNASLNYITQTVYNGSGGSASISVTYSSPGGYYCAICEGADGNIYTLTSTGYITQIAPSGGSQTTIATSLGTVNYNNCMGVDSSNNIYISIGRTIYKYNNSGTQIAYYVTGGTVSGLQVDLNNSLVSYSTSVDTGILSLDLSVIATTTLYYGQIATNKYPTL